MIAVLGAVVVSMSAQTQSSTVQVSKLVGTKVKSSQGEEIGVVKDVMIDRSTGCMAYTVLSTSEGGARAAAAGKLVAVPWAVYSPASDVNVLTVTVDRERIYSAPVFDYARIDEYSRPDYITNVYGYYGVSPGAEIGAGVSRTTTTGHWKVTGRGGFTSRQRIATSARDSSETSRYGAAARTRGCRCEPSGYRGAPESQTWGNGISKQQNKRRARHETETGRNRIREKRN